MYSWRFWLAQPSFPFFVVIQFSTQLTATLLGGNMC
jgi:hypothetical protein